MPVHTKPDLNKALYIHQQVKVYNEYRWADKTCKNGMV